LIALSGQDWLVVTPEGLFDGSPGGIRNVTYRTQNDFDLLSPEKLPRGFQHPGLLQSLLNGERPQPPKTHK
jgi:hypothetical protein